MPTGSSTFTGDQGKYIQDTLIARSELIHKLPQFCEPVELPEKMGTTANMIRYNRTDTMMAPLSEGTTPAETPFTILSQSVVVNQWGLFISLTDVAVVTTKHPVLNESLDLVADAIARAHDYNIAEVFNLGTNVQYWDGSRANRAAITATDVFKAEVFHKARADFGNKGAPPRDGDLFVAVFGPSVESDILNEAASVGSFTAAHQTTKQEKLEMGVIGDWLGFRCVRSNFLPQWSTTALITPSAAAGGSLSGTVYWKVTRKATLRGFEEVIDAQGSTSMGANGTLNFVAPSTAGYVYNGYVGTVTGDANLFVAFTNLQPSQTATVTVAPTSGANPPATPTSGVVVNPIYCFARKGVDMVALTGMSITGSITPKGPSDSDPLEQRRKVGSKYMEKAGIRDNDRAKRIELASNF